MDIFTEARNLVQRYEKGDAFRLYMQKRWPLIIAPLLLFLAFSLAAGLGLMGLAGTSKFLGFLAILVAPVIIVGSLFVQVYVFFSWLELRATGRMAHHDPRPAKAGWLWELQSRLGKPPPVPWLPVTVFVVAPFVLLALASVKAASVLLALAILMPVVYSFVDR
jgi:hypothetical protein